MKDLKYEYALHTWGGFYNKEYDHDEIEGTKYFDSEEERGSYIIKLQNIEKKLGAHTLALSKFEGYNVRTPIVLNRVTRNLLTGEVVHTTRDASPCSYEANVYFMTYKWHPGFNDYPFGEDFEYINANFKVIEQWISGYVHIDYEDE